MEILDHLTKRVQEAAQEIISLKKERQRLFSEIELLREQLSQHHVVARESEKLHRTQDRLRIKLEKINNKLGKCLLVEPSSAVFSQGEKYENHNE